MKKILVTICYMFICFMMISQNKNNNLQESLPAEQDTVIINAFWGYKYPESPLYIKNKDYVVFQYRNDRKILYPDMQSFRIIRGNDDCAIAVDKNGVYYQGIFMPVDTAEIKLVGERYINEDYQFLWKNKEKVFRDTVEVKGIDAKTFQSIKCFNGVYFKDKNYVYYFDKKIEGSDGATVNKTCGEVCYDKNHIYIDGEVATYNGEKLQSVNSILAKTNNVVIDRSTMQPVEDIDAASLVKLSDSYSMDKNHVYFRATKMPIKKANLKHVKVWEQVNRRFVTDGVNIYSENDIYEIPEKNLDAKTFGMLPQSDFTYDKNGVYERDWIDEKKEVVLRKFPFNYSDWVIPQVNTFITDNSLYIVYKNQAYDPWKKKLYSNLSPQEIELIKDGAFLPIDKNVSEADKPELRSIGYGYTKNGNSIYYGSQELLGIEDADSFTPLNFMYVKDKYKVYSMNQEYISNQTKYTLTSIEGADPHTFELNVLPFDKNFVYAENHPLIASKDIEFLAIFSGYRPGCGLDRTPSSNYIFMKNRDGFWFLETSYDFGEKMNLQYLGKNFNRKWNKVFEDFEFAK